MLPQQILAVIVAVRRPDDGVDVLLVRARRGGEVAEVGRVLMVELDQDHRAVDAVIEDAAGIGFADPREVGAIDVPAHFFHPRA